MGPLHSARLARTRLHDRYAWVYRQKAVAVVNAFAAGPAHLTYMIFNSGLDIRVTDSPPTQLPHVATFNMASGRNDRRQAGGERSEARRHACHASGHS